MKVTTDSDLDSTLGEVSCERACQPSLVVLYIQLILNVLLSLYSTYSS